MTTLSETLQILIGKKVLVVTKSIENISGALIEVGTDYISLKNSCSKYIPISSIECISVSKNLDNFVCDNYEAGTGEVYIIE